MIQTQFICIRERGKVHYRTLCIVLSHYWCLTEAVHLHVKVLLGVFYVPFNFSVYVKVKLLGHWQWDQWRPLRVWFLTVAKKIHNDS